jgi:hypothetical protein
MIQRKNLNMEACYKRYYAQKQSIQNLYSLFKSPFSPLHLPCPLPFSPTSTCHTCPTQHTQKSLKSLYEKIALTENSAEKVGGNGYMRVEDQSTSEERSDVGEEVRVTLGEGESEGFTYLSSIPSELSNIIEESFQEKVDKKEERKERIKDE